MPNSKNARPIVMVSSTVYGVEELLERIFALLASYGYEVWCSHIGTTPVKSTLTAFENCRKAVDDCDLFLGIITPQYGSGKDGSEISITHQEVLRAIEIDKPRWFLAHDHVIFTRRLFEKLSVDDVVLGSDAGRAKLKLHKSPLMDDLRVLDIYEAATRQYKPGTRIEIALKDRKGNWVQKYINAEDAMRFAMAQFHRFQEVEEFIKERFENREELLKRIPKPDRGDEQP